MDLNSILFPSPELSHDLDQHEDELIYIPKIKYSEKDINNTPNNKITSEDKILGFIPCLLLQSKKKNLNSKNFLIYFHGNAEDIFFAREIADRMRQNLMMNILIVEYPGYSIYSEEKNADKILEDTLYVFDYLVYKLGIEPNYIYVFGRSIGSAPSCYLASKREFAGLTLMSPFISIKSVAKNLVGMFSFLVSERFENIEYLKSVSCPILFVHGQKDTLIPFDHTLKLKEVCCCPVEVNLPEEMDHNRFDYENDLLFPIKDFYKRNTAFNQNETCDIDIPYYLFEVPNSMKHEISSIKNKEVNVGCFGGEIKK